MNALRPALAAALISISSADVQAESIVFVQCGPACENQMPQPNTDFVAAYKTKFSTDPDQFAAQSYTAMIVLADALKRAGNATDRAAVKKGEKGGFFPGSFLLTAERPWIQADEPQPEPLAAEPPTPEEIAGDRQPVNEVPESFWASYFAQRPEGFLVDPQKLLKPEQHAQQLRFLTDHAGDSTIDLR